jgi:hypothetical protein
MSHPTPTLGRCRFEMQLVHPVSAPVWLLASWIAKRLPTMQDGRHRGVRDEVDSRRYNQTTTTTYSPVGQTQNGPGVGWCRTQQKGNRQAGWEKKKKKRARFECVAIAARLVEAGCLVADGSLGWARSSRVSFQAAGICGL